MMIEMNVKATAALNHLVFFLNEAVPHALELIEQLDDEDTDNHWRLFKLISEMRDIINNPPKV